MSTQLAAEPRDAEADLTPAERLAVDTATALMISAATVVGWTITLAGKARQHIRTTH